MAFLKLRDQVGEGRRGGIAPPRTRRRVDKRRGPPGRSPGAVAPREEGVPGPERCGPSACQCGPGSEKPTCGPGIATAAAAAATGAGSALTALASGALPGRRLLFPAR